MMSVARFFLFFKPADRTLGIKSFKHFQVLLKKNMV